MYFCDYDDDDDDEMKKLRAIKKNQHLNELRKNKVELVM